jgi:hypothetical protein
MISRIDAENRGRRVETVAVGRSELFWHAPEWLVIGPHGLRVSIQLGPCNRAVSTARS